MSEQKEGSETAPLSFKKLAIVGSGLTWKSAPYDDMGVDIWTISTMCDQCLRYDVVFDMHKGGHPEIFEILKNLTCPIYMQKKHDRIPGSVEYPIEKAIEVFGRHFASTISYMLALAIIEGYGEIGIYGVSMAHNSEYRNQRISCDYLIGFAKGAGIKITIQTGEDLCKTMYLYGYEIPPMLEKMKLRSKMLEVKLEGFEYEKEKLDKKINMHKGALEDCQYFIEYFE